MLITAGKHYKELTTAYSVVDSTSAISVKMLRRGGFVAVATPL